MSAPQLAQRGAAANAIKVGDVIPEFMLPSANGRFVRSADLLAKGPVALSFYRGAWCPFCRTELTALRDAHRDVIEAGGQIVSIAAEVGGRAMNAMQKHGLPFEVLCDVDLGVSLAFGLVFAITEEVREIYGRLGYDLEAFNGNDSWFLPVPATYVVAPDGVVAAAFIEPDFRYRMEPADIVNAIKAINSRRS